MLELNGELKSLIITRAEIVENDLPTSPGTIIRADKKKFVIACGSGALEIAELIVPGKKAMPGANFLNGCRENLAGKNLLQVNHVQS